MSKGVLKIYADNESLATYEEPNISEGARAQAEKDLEDTCLDAWEPMVNSEWERIRSLCKFWRELGLNQEQIVSRSEVLGKYFDGIFEQVINKEYEYKKQLQAEVDTLRSQVSAKAAELETDSKLDIIDGQPLIASRIVLKSVLQDLQREYDSRIAIAKAIREDINAVRKHMGLSPLAAIVKSVTPSALAGWDALREECLEQFNIQKQDVLAKLETLSKARAALTDSNLSLLSETLEEHVTLFPIVLATMAKNADPNNPHSAIVQLGLRSTVLDANSLTVWTSGAMLGFITQLIGLCEGDNAARRRKSKDLRAKITRLYLQAKQAEAIEIEKKELPAEALFDDATLTILQNEETRLVTLMRKHREALLQMMEKRVRSLVGDMRMSSIEQSMLLEHVTHDNIETGLLDKLVRALENRQESVQPILRLLSRFEKLLTQKRMLDEAEKDPALLLAKKGQRPLTLDDENKLRDAVSNELPAILERLISRLQAFETSNWYPLSMRGDKDSDCMPYDFIVEVAVKRAMATGEFPTVRDASARSQSELERVKTGMTAWIQSINAMPLGSEPGSPKGLRTMATIGNLSPGSGPSTPTGLRTAVRSSPTMPPPSTALLTTLKSS